MTSTVSLRDSILILLVLFLSCTKKDSTSNKLPSYVSSNTFFDNEIKPATTKSCYAGAYYRKLVSSIDYWGGISGRVILPEITFDPSRINPAKPAQFLDNPSVYVGGNMGGQETDIGLTWEVIRDENGNVTADRRAFRPFLRRTAHGGSGQAATYENAPAEAKYYWYPSEEVFMSVKIVANGTLRFTVEGAGKKFEKDFACGGYTLGTKGEFKRVNAIDQVANEGKPAQATRTKVVGAEWKATNIYRVANGQLVEAPFHSERYTDMQCPGTTNFSISATLQDRAIGAEKISIYGAGY
jgi:hypothetical protein